MKTRIAAVAIIATLSVALVAPAMAQNGTLQNNLFSQYTTYPGTSEVTAGLYPAPYSAPNWVGQTYYTNQALMPHEMMYQHRRNYYNYYAGPATFYKNPCNNRGGGGGLNKTTVVWQSGCNHFGPFLHNVSFLQNLHYRHQSRYYCLGGNCGHQRHAAGCGGCGSSSCHGGCEAEAAESSDNGTVTQKRIRRALGRQANQVNPQSQRASR